MESQPEQVVRMGQGSLAELVAVVAKAAASRVLLVLDQRAYKACGTEKMVTAALRDVQVNTFTNFEPNPKLEDVERGIELYQAASPDLVIALGGGTAIDLGKLITNLGCQNAKVRDLIVGTALIKFPGTPLVAIPTTAGTGSEATHFAVVYVDGEKYSVAHDNLLPRYAIVDPRLTHSLPPTMTAATGLDAFCQAIESIWAVGATDESIEYASEAIGLAMQYLAEAVHRPTPDARDGMSRASHLAGKAINISKTTLPHAISYAVTSDYGVPHGVAVAMTLRQIFTYNAEVGEDDCIDPRGPTHVARRIGHIVNLLGAEDTPAASRRIEKLLVEVGCPTSFAEVGINGEEAIREVVEQVNVERMSNNPRDINIDGLVKLLGPNSLSPTAGPPSKPGGKSHVRDVSASSKAVSREVFD